MQTLLESPSGAIPVALPVEEQTELARLESLIERGKDLLAELESLFATAKAASDQPLQDVWNACEKSPRAKAIRREVIKLLPPEVRSCIEDGVLLYNKSSQSEARFQFAQAFFHEGMPAVNRRVDELRQGRARHAEWVQAKVRREADREARRPRWLDMTKEDRMAKRAEHHEKRFRRAVAKVESAAQRGIRIVPRGFCPLCRKHLTDPVSIALGIGPECRAQLVKLFGRAKLDVLTALTAYLSGFAGDTGRES